MSDETQGKAQRAGAAGIGSRTLRGVFWAYGSYVGGRALVLVATGVLARLLTPKEFGLVALALIFTGLLETVKDLGVTQALVVAPEGEEAERAETVWVISVGLGLALTLIVAALAPLGARFFDEPELALLLPVLALNFFFRALGATHYALAQKRLDFRARTLAEMSDVLVRGTAGIGLALAGFGAWSLVLGYLTGTIAMTAALWILIPWRPHLRWRRRHVRALLSFGGTLTAVDIVSAFIGQLDHIFVGKVLGPSALGLYSLASRLPELFIQNLAVVAGDVLYPAFAAVDREALGHAFLVSLRYTIMVTLPLAVALGILAEPFVLAAFGEQWVSSIDALRVLALYALVSTLAIPAGTAYKATGRAGVLLLLSVPRALLLVISLALFTGEGIVAVAACQAVGTVLLTASSTVLASRLLAVGFRRIGTALWPPIVAGVGMAAVLYLVERAIDSAWLALVCGAVAGGSVYLGILVLVARDSVDDLLAKAMPGRFGATQEIASSEAGAAETKPPRAIP